jgi:hypothetical protein
LLLRLFGKHDREENKSSCQGESGRNPRGEPDSLSRSDAFGEDPMRTPHDLDVGVGCVVEPHSRDREARDVNLPKELVRWAVGELG